MCIRDRNSKLLLGLTQSSALTCTQSTDQTKENFALDKDAKIVICLYPRITVRFLIAKKSLRLSRRLFFAIRRENRLSSFQPSRLLMQIVSDFKVGDGHRPGKIIPQMCIRDRASPMHAGICSFYCGWLRFISSCGAALPCISPWACFAFLPPASSCPESCRRLSCWVLPFIT